MAVSYKKLLPKIMRDTRWGDLVDVIQSIWYDIKITKIYPIYTHFTTSAILVELKDICNFLGHTLLTLDGLTSTKAFILREAESISYKIKYKTGLIAYKWSGYPFNLISNAFTAIMSKNDPIWDEKLATLFSQEQVQDVKQLVNLDAEADNILYYEEPLEMNFDSTTGGFAFDSGDITFDYKAPIYLYPKKNEIALGYLDEDYNLNPASTENLQEATISSQKIVRSIVYDYYHKRVENDTEFLSTNSLMVLKNDIDQVKKVTEKVFYTPRLKINFNADLSSNIKTFYNFEDELTTATQESVMSVANLQYIDEIQFGSGTIASPLTGTITGVAAYMYYIPSGILTAPPSGVASPSGVPSGVVGWNWQEETTLANMSIDFIIPEDNHFEDFTEIALCNSVSGCLGYAKFPKVQWLDNMTNNIHLELTIV